MKRKIFRILQYILHLFPGKIRVAFLKLFGMKIGEGSQVWPDCYFETPWLIQIGKGCLVNKYTKFFNSTETPITLGDNVFISYNVTLLGVTHEINSSQCRCGKVLYKPINIQDGSWLGAGCVIMPGVTIGKGCVIGAGAVVTKDCQPNTVYAGVPAKPIRKL